jgi:ribonuclease HII
MQLKPQFIIGVDEAGRGPLAGPVAVGIACIQPYFDWNLLPGVDDSKKLLPEKRERIFNAAQRLQKEGRLNFSVCLIRASIIDKIGITKAVRRGISRGLRRLALNPEEVEVRLDGLLRAPKEYRNQTTIIGGDAKEKVIGLASIIAKVIRDRHMIRISNKYPEYLFHTHKGYATETHRGLVLTHGLCEIHRKTYCSNLLLDMETTEAPPRYL